MYINNNSVAQSLLLLSLSEILGTTGTDTTAVSYRYRALSGCGVLLKLRRSRARGASAFYLEMHNLLCLYNSLDAETALEVFKLSKK